MERLGSRDLRALLAVVCELEHGGELATFPERVLPLVRRLVPCDIITYNEVNPRLHQLRAVADPPGSIPPTLTGRLAPHVHEHPLITYYEQTGDGRALKFSDFLSQRQLRELGMYQEFYRPLSVGYQMALTLPAPAPLVLGIALNRTGHDFGERDRALLDLLRPHLVQAYATANADTDIRRTLDALERAADEDGKGVAILYRSGLMPIVTPRARRWLAAYFGGPTTARDPLPEPVRAWVTQQRRRLDDDDAPGVAAPLVAERAGRRLVIRFACGRVADEPDLLLLAERPAGDASAARLTPRERAVLAHVSQGETNPEIGARLEMSYRTVEKHLEHIFRKLDVGTRTAAAAWAIQHDAPDG